MKYSKFILPFIFVTSAHAMTSFEETNFSKKTTSVSVDEKNLFIKKTLEFAEILYPERKLNSGGFPAHYFLTQDELSGVLFSSLVFKFTDNPKNTTDEVKNFKDFIKETKSDSSNASICKIVDEITAEFFQLYLNLYLEIPSEYKPLQEEIYEYPVQDHSQPATEFTYQKSKTTTEPAPVLLRKKEKKPSMRRRFSDFVKKKSPKFSRK